MMGGPGWGAATTQKPRRLLFCSAMHNTLTAVQIAYLAALVWATASAASPCSLNNSDPESQATTYINFFVDF